MQKENFKARTQRIAELHTMCKYQEVRIGETNITELLDKLNKWREYYISANCKLCIYSSSSIICTCQICNFTAFGN